MVQLVVTALKIWWIPKLIPYPLSWAWSMCSHREYSSICNSKMKGPWVGWRTDCPLCLRWVCVNKTKAMNLRLSVETGWIIIYQYTNIFKFLGRNSQIRQRFALQCVWFHLQLIFDDMVLWSTFGLNIYFFGSCVLFQKHFKQRLLLVQLKQVVRFAQRVRYTDITWAMCRESEPESERVRETEHYLCVQSSCTGSKRAGGHMRGKEPKHRWQSTGTKVGERIPSPSQIKGALEVNGYLITQQGLL